MALVLLDTDVFSFLFKRDTRAALYAPHLVGAQPCLSFQTIAELRLWTMARNWGASRKQALEDAFGRCMVLPSDDALCQRWAQITDQRRRMGRRIECGDAWIAATAVQHGLTLLTHNARDYADITELSLVTHGEVC